MIPKQEAIYIVRSQTELDYLVEVVPELKTSTLITSNIKGLLKNYGSKVLCIRVNAKGIFRSYAELSFYEKDKDYSHIPRIETSTLMSDSTLKILEDILA